MAADRSPPDGLLSAPRVARLRDAFDTAIDLPEPQRDAWIDDHVADADDRAALRLLLRADARTGPLDVPSGDRYARIGAEPEFVADALVGQRFGAFRLLRLLGTGGMAAVFLGARDDGAFAQQVAVKILRRGLYAADEQRRFRREQQALAALSHPNIAHLIDGGVSDAGIPYLVLEYVDGVPLTRYAAEHALDLRARLALFVVVCRAVAAAHRQLIVHRDLKPSNILVDAEGRVKLLDFGIAKFLDDDEDDATRNGYAALTPGYAASEQYSAGPITTATDVYALGVVLQELLLGGRVADAGDDDDAKPSALVHDTTRVTWPLPQPRATLGAALRGDLDDIVRTARASEADRRYATASELADDLQRHLDGRPVRAHPPSGWYRTTKFVRRHRGSVALTAVFAIGVLASASVALWQAKAARAEAERARAEAQRANTTRDFLESLFEPVSEQLAEGSMPSLRDLVGTGAARIDTTKDLAPAQRVELMIMFSRLQFLLAEPAPALALAQRAQALAASALPADSPLSAQAMFTLGRAYVGTTDFAKARPWLAEAERRMRAIGATGADYIELLAERAAVENELGERALALAYARREFDARLAFYPKDDPGIATGYNNLGYALEANERYDEAIDAYRRALELDSRTLDPHSLQRTFPLGNLAQAEFNAGRLLEARGHFAEALAIHADVALDKPTRAELGQLAMLANTEIALGAFDRAEPVVARYLTQAEKTPPTQSDRAIAQRYAGYLALERGRYDDARARFDATLALAAALEPYATTRLRGRVLAHRGEIALAEGRVDEAVRDLSHGLEAMGDAMYPAYIVPYTRALLAQACGARRDGPCASDLLPAVLTALDAPALRDHPAMLGAHAAVARALLDRGERDAAIARLDAAIRTATERGVEPDSPRLRDLQSLLARARTPG